MADEILEYLARVEAERAARLQDPAWAARVTLVKAYQQQRFRRTYADLLDSERYAKAAGFFLEELYGPAGFEQRDAQFARIVPRLVTMMPSEVVATVRDLAHLHSVSEVLDSAMGRALAADSLRRSDYVRAWRWVGQRDQRELQLRLVLEMGGALEAFTKRAWIVTALRVMRGPAQAAGLSALQHFLETGLGSFRSMRGATEFLRLVEARESALIEALFFEQAPDHAQSTANSAGWSRPLDDLPLDA